MKNQTTEIQIIVSAAKLPEYDPSTIKALMHRLDMNERAFSLIMNVTPMTVRLWTSGAVQPCRLSCRLMQIFDACPEIIGTIVSREIH